VFIGQWEHQLTTDLLNQLLFVQEAFRRELGDILVRAGVRPTADTFESLIPTLFPRLLFPDAHLARRASTPNASRSACRRRRRPRPSTCRASTTTSRRCCIH
jgi:hypothetical protein